MCFQRDYSRKNGNVNSIVTKRERIILCDINKKRGETRGQKSRVKEKQPT